MTFLTGGVTVERPDLTLQGSRAMMWKSKASDHPFDEIYAEGNVIITRGGQKLQCERFFYSEVTEKGAIVDVRLKAYSRDLKADFFAMAKEARIDQQKMYADNVSLTSCSYGVPHYHLTVEHATLLGAEEGETTSTEKKGHYGIAPFGDNCDPVPFTTFLKDDTVVQHDCYAEYVAS